MTEKVKRKMKKSNKILIGLFLFILIFSIGSMVLIKNLYDLNFKRVENKDPKTTGFISYSDVVGYDRTKVEFESGKNTLTGYIYGESNTKGLVVISHGLGGSAEDYLPETLYFVDKGWRVFAINNTGVQESEGRNSIGIPQSVIDLDAALTYIESNTNLKDLPVLLYGHSWGGYAVTAVLNYNHRISASASLAGFNSPMGLLKEQAVNMIGFFAYAEYPYLWTYQTMLFGSTARITAVDGINKSDIPVMIIHGDKDDTISYYDASIISHQNEITNQHVIYKTCSANNRNGHNNLNLSTAASKYIDEKNKIYKELYDSYHGKIPYDVRTKYYKDIDKSLTSQLDADFMGEIDSFFEEALSSRTE